MQRRFVFLAPSDLGGRRGVGGCLPPVSYRCACRLKGGGATPAVLVILPLSPTPCPAIGGIPAVHRYAAEQGLGIDRLLALFLVHLDQLLIIRCKLKINLPDILVS
jgi:hypothetical protein